jgi:hypothetical protein
LVITSFRRFEAQNAIPNHTLQTDRLTAPAELRVMRLSDDDKLFLVVRCLGAVGGLIGGAMSGTILIVFLIVFTGSTFGLTNIWSGSVTGAIIGAVLGFVFPRIGKSLIGLFTSV